MMAFCPPAVRISNLLPLIVKDAADCKAARNAASCYHDTFRTLTNHLCPAGQTNGDITAVDLVGRGVAVAAAVTGQTSVRAKLHRQARVDQRRHQRVTAVIVIHHFPTGILPAGSAAPATFTVTWRKMTDAVTLQHAHFIRCRRRRAYLFTALTGTRESFKPLALRINPNRLNVLHRPSERGAFTLVNIGANQR